MSEEKTNKGQKRAPAASFWISVAVGIVFVVIASVAAFLTGYLLGVRGAPELATLAILSAVIGVIGVALLIAIAFLFHRKAQAALKEQARPPDADAAPESADGAEESEKNEQAP